jgi:hypothetical protein
MSYEELLEVVRSYWSDTSRSPDDLIEDFNSLIEEIEIMVDALDADRDE